MSGKQRQPVSKYGLNEKEERFCLQFIQHLDPRKAYVEAGYKSKNYHSLAEAASHMMKKPQIKNYIRVLRMQTKRRAMIEVDKIVQTLASIVTADMRGFFNDDGTGKKINQLTEEQGQILAALEVQEVSADGDAVYAITRKLKTWDKIAACRLLLQRLGELEDKKPKTMVLTGPGGGPIKTESAHEHKLDKAAFKQFLADIGASVENVSDDGGEQSLDQEAAD